MIHMMLFYKISRLGQIWVRENQERFTKQKLQYDLIKRLLTFRNILIRDDKSQQIYSLYF